MAQITHYDFAHQILPSAFFADPVEFGSKVRSDPQSLKSLWPQAALQHMWRSLEGQGEVLVITLPPPDNPAEAYHVALLCTEKPRYFTIEHASSADCLSMLGEWQGSNRVGHGEGPEPTVDSFCEAIAELLKNAGPVLRMSPEEFQVSVVEARLVVGSAPYKMTFNKFVSCHCALLMALPNRPLYSLLKLRWWSPRKRATASHAYRTLALFILYGELRKKYPERENEIIFAVATNAVLRFRMESYPEEVPEDCAAYAAAVVSKMYPTAPAEAIISLFREQQQLFEGSIAHLEVPTSEA